MVRFAINAIAQAIPLMVLVALLIFTMLQFMPGDPLHAMVGQYPVPHEFRATIEKRYHLSDPLASRPIQYFGNLLSKRIYDGKDRRSLQRLVQRTSELGGRPAARECTMIAEDRFEPGAFGERSDTRR
jgi:peptide/nickel transport system permease protein